MSLHADLLEQAGHLARRERRRPRQASLRRAISSAYYALFHLLVHDAGALIVSVPAIRRRAARTFEHSEMKLVSIEFASPKSKLLSLVGAVAVPADLQQVALAFVELQEARHEADYNTSRVFTRPEALLFVARAEDAFQRWAAIRNDPVVPFYLAAMLLGKKWSR